MYTFFQTHFINKKKFWCSNLNLFSSSIQYIIFLHRISLYYFANFRNIFVICYYGFESHILAFFICRILYNLLTNNFVDEQLKSRVRVAARQSRSSLKSNNANQASAWCSVYKCHLIESQFTEQRSSKPASNHRTHRYVYS